MASVAEKEVEQKTSEYMRFIKNFFDSSGVEMCSGRGGNFEYAVYVDGDQITLIYKDS